MSTIRIANTFATPELDPASRVRDVLESSLRARGFPSSVQAEVGSRPCPVYWSAEHFVLNRSSLFVHASQEQQQRILSLLSQQTLEEACLIEKSGMSFTAKMALLSETTQERMLYSMFSADETIHLQQILAYLPESPELGADRPFLSLLSEMIQKGQRESLVLLIQVVLEGWGITHYHALAENCLSPELKTTLKMILKDEARHHGSGMLLSKAAPIPEVQKDFLLETLVSFLTMVRCGPQGVVGAMEQVLGRLSLDQKITLHEELGSEVSSQGKLDLLKQLLEQGGSASLAEDLEKLGAFRAHSARECAEI